MPILISDDERDLLQRLEENLWRADTRFDAAYMQKVLAKDFIEYGRSGRIYSRQQIIDQPSQPINASLPLPNLDIRLLTPEIALITYNSAVTYDGIIECAHRSSIWSRTPIGWELRFHQGTPFDPDN